MRQNGVMHLRILLITAFLYFFTGCALFDDPKNPYATEPVGTTFSKGQALVASGDCTSAIPFLNQTLAKHFDKQSEEYQQSLLLITRCYDQLGLPEKAVMTADEGLKLNMNVLKAITLKALRMKNQAKLRMDIAKSADKKDLQLAMTQERFDKKYLLDALAWPLEFRCDQYCLAEIEFLKEIQLSLLYLIEQNSEASAKTTDSLISSYSFFSEAIQKSAFSKSYRLNLHIGLIDSIKKLNALHMTKAVPTPDTQRLFSKLNEILKTLEGQLIQ